MTEHQCFQDGCQGKPTHKFSWPWAQEAAVCAEHVYAVAQTATNLGLALAPQLVPLIPASAAERAHNFLAAAESVLAHAHETWMRLSELVSKFEAAEAEAATEPAAAPPPSELTASPATSVGS